ncbi:cytochrome C oxidase subunit IV family protein [Novosphingobium resinovorum]|jgi:hypothetical protein|uniref:Cytochrome C oxidase subunit IV n=1 Tax=Novosphingobium resinovorum TaxID=158500 RepID=A0A1D8AE72_9SPHN|nr:cytochrome C oxidase subunit IV family protein [Novosphingobium resinovorum]AOR80414.1 hypothetical protein BES08_26450 [Novosphingobium resinovorum]
MPSILANRAVLVWAVLVAATLLSFETTVLGNSGAVILVVAFAKVLLVGREFMELRDAPAPMLWAFQSWVVAVCGVLLALFFA